MRNICQKWRNRKDPKLKFKGIVQVSNLISGEKKQEKYNYE